MIIVNSKGKKVYQGENKTKVAGIVGYDRRSINRWVEKGLQIKKSYNGFMLYLNEDLYKPKTIKK